MPEFRRLQQTGSDTFLISLPKTWIRENKLHKGDPLVIGTLESGTLIISPQRDNRNREKIRSRIIESERVEEDIFANYLAGFEVIEVIREDGKPLQFRENVANLLPRLFGLDIMFESADRIELEFSTDTASLGPRKILHRCFSIAITMTKEVIEALLTKDKNLAVERAQAVVDRDKQVNRLYFLVVRMLREMVQQINAHQAVSPIECLDFRMVGNLAEGLGDQAVELARYIIINPGLGFSSTAEHSIRKLSSESHQILNEAITAFNTSQQDKALKTKDKANIQIIASLQGLLELYKDDSHLPPELIFLLHQFFRETFEVVVDLADLAMGVPT
ncbi:MAG: PhoU domain-containing protein [Candidatus Hodarchaeota archaeon]